jgi:hypothetical protein
MHTMFDLERRLRAVERELADERAAHAVTQAERNGLRRRIGAALESLQAFTSDVGEDSYVERAIEALKP